MSDDAESIERWKAVTIDDVKALYQSFIGGQYGELVVVGDFSPDELVPQMEEILGKWKSSEAYARIERPTTEDHRHPRGDRDSGQGKRRLSRSHRAADERRQRITRRW